MATMEEQIGELRAENEVLSILVVRTLVDISDLSLRYHLLKQSVAQLGIPSEAIDEAHGQLFKEHWESHRDRIDAVLRRFDGSDRLRVTLQSIDPDAAVR